ITQRAAANVVSAATDRGEQIISVCEVKRSDDIGCPRASCDDARSLICAGIPDLSRIVVAAVTSFEDTSPEPRAEWFEIQVPQAGKILLQRRPELSRYLFILPGVWQRPERGFLQ